MFPLQSIFFPGETIPLHVFEDRYKELISDCRNEAITFGIPVYIDGKIDYGIEAQLVEVVTTYEGGEMDVICVARQVFSIKEFIPVINGKLYPSGEVSFLELDYVADEELKKEVLKAIETLYMLMGAVFTPIAISKFNSYMLAHKIGLSFKQEYELLQIVKENDRLFYLKKHLLKTIAVLEEVNRTKKTIELNGHFRNFDPLDFDGFDH